MELANLLASSENMIDSIGAEQSGQPQYLMPTRHTVFSQLANSYPNYKKMYDLVNSANPILFTLDQDAKTWLESMKGTLTRMVSENYTCGCDIVAGQIWNQQDAESKCPFICAEHGGWSGQWVTTVEDQNSVCGCNTCPVGSILYRSGK